MRHSTIKTVEERIEKLVRNFGHYMDYFNKNNPFSGPSEYFYINRIIRATKSDDNLVINRGFLCQPLNFAEP